MIAAVVRDLAERQRFDEGEVAAGPGAMIEHREQLILVEPGKRDHVDLDRQSRIARRLDPAQRDGQIADACDMAERRRIERVEADVDAADAGRSEEHTSELQSLMRISYAVFCLKKKNKNRK